MIAMSKRDGASKKREPFGERVRGLMTKQGLTQAQLADRCDIAPAVLSRILSADSDREPTMAHVLAIATALNVTALELVGGTTAEDVLADWVPKERYDESERARLDALSAAEVSRADVASRDAEIGVLRTRVTSLGNDKAKLEAELARQRGELELGRQYGEQLRDALAQLSLLQADNEGLRKQSAEYTEKLGDCHAQLTNVSRAYEDARSRAADVQRQLAESKSSAAGSAAAAAIVGGLFGAVIATSGKKSRY